MNNEEIKIEDTERYQYLMDESMRLYPQSCQWMIHVAVCEQIMEEQGIDVDSNDVDKMKNLYCKKLEYDDVIVASKNSNEYE